MYDLYHGHLMWDVGTTDEHRVQDSTGTVVIQCLIDWLLTRGILCVYLDLSHSIPRIIHLTLTLFSVL